MKLLIIKNVKKHFGGIAALDGCSLEVKKGSITALIGPNGSGKTTLFDVISQLIDEDDGEIIFQDHHIEHYTPFTAYKVANHGISRTFQDVRLFKHLTIKEHLLLAQSDTDTQIFSNLIAGKHEEAHTLKEVARVLALVNLDKDINTKARDLSYGQRKLLDLAMAIIKPHKLLMLDEPVAGVNPRIRQ